MTDADRLQLNAVISELDDAIALFEAAIKPISNVLERTVKNRRKLIALRIAQQKVPDAKPTEHRRDHKSGRAPKIDTDPELKAFLLARVDRMTFVDMAADVAKHFPPDRRVGKTTIHLWWSRLK